MFFQIIQLVRSIWKSLFWCLLSVFHVSLPLSKAEERLGCPKVVYNTLLTFKQVGGDFFFGDIGISKRGMRSLESWNVGLRGSCGPLTHILVWETASVASSLGGLQLRSLHPQRKGSFLLPEAACSQGLFCWAGIHLTWHLVLVLLSKRMKNRSFSDGLYSWDKGIEILGLILISDNLELALDL